MAVGDACTLRIVGRYQSQNIVNTMYYRIVTQTSGDNDILQSLCTAWDTTFETLWDARHIDTYTLIGLKAFKKTGTPKTPGFLSVGDAGTVVGDEVPSFVCRTLTLYTASTNSRRRGRLMLSGSAQSMFDAADGSLTSGEIGALNTLGATLIGAISNAGDEFEPGLPPTLADTWQDFTDYKARETPSSIRSRRIRQFLVG
jgi:hypothetical protein